MRPFVAGSTQTDQVRQPVRVCPAASSNVVHIGHGRERAVFTHPPTTIVNLLAAFGIHRVTLPTTVGHRPQRRSRTASSNRSMLSWNSWSSSGLILVPYTRWKVNFSRSAVRLFSRCVFTPWQVGHAHMKRRRYSIACAIGFRPAAPQCWQVASCATVWPCPNKLCLRTHRTHERL